ncbi:MAG: hypothetical protein ACK55I_43745, partial [bacterium]
VCILCEVNESGVAVFENIVHQFLHHPEYNQFLLHFHSVIVVVKAATRVDGAGSIDLLKKVIDG